MRASQPPLEYLVTSSQTSLEAFELTRLNRSANLRKELRDILDEWLQTEVDARIARWILECRRAQNGDPTSLAAPPPEPVRIAQLAMSFLPEPVHPAALSEAITPKASDVTEKCSQNGRGFCASPHSRDFHQPMTSKDAAASLRLLEQFLLCSAQPIELAEEDFQCSQSSIVAPPQNQSSHLRDAPLENRAATPNCATYAASPHRRMPRKAPSVRTGILLTARYNR